MSATPKRLHEDGGHPATAKRLLEDNSVLSSIKLIQPATNEYHLAVEPNTDGRITKIQRLENREVDKRSSILPYRISSPANGSSLEHPHTSHNRTELRELNDGRDTKGEVSDKKAGIREMHIEARLDPQNSKEEKDAKQDTRSEVKEIKYDRESLVDFRSDIKVEKYSSAAANAPSIRKDPNPVRYSESSTDVTDQRRVLRYSLNVTMEADKETPNTKGQESSNVHEGGGNKVELKGEEKTREKERTRKDEKYRDWGDRDKSKHDCSNNMHLSSSSKECLREDKDFARSERDRKDSMKEKDPKDRERDLMKRASSNTNLKDNFQTEKETMDISPKISEKGHTAVDMKKAKEVDSWKISDRDNKEKKRDRDRDRDQDIEADRHDKRNKGIHVKDEDGDTEGDDTVDRDKDAFSHAVQQRKRMQRQKGTPQREQHFSSKSRENEGSQEKADISTIVYKVGECLQDLLKSWNEYQSTQIGNGEDTSLQNGRQLVIRIPTEHVTATNRQVKAGQLWGTDIYSVDSDLVAVLIHTGYIRPTSTPPPPAIQELQATIRVLPPQPCYTSTLRNNVRSRAWTAGIACSYRVEKCCIVKKGGGTIDIEPRLAHIFAIEPTLAPISVERTMTTRSAASNALRQQRLAREVTIQYNLCFEPWMKYSINVVADKGLKKAQYTSARLKKGEVLYLETHSVRYELCFACEKAICNGNPSAPESVQEKSVHHGHNNTRDVFRWSRCKKALPQDLMKSTGIPSPLDQVEVIEDNLEWEDVQWSQNGVFVAGKEYPIVKVHFLQKT